MELTDTTADTVTKVVVLLFAISMLSLIGFISFDIIGNPSDSIIIYFDGYAVDLMTLFILVISVNFDMIVIIPLLNSIFDRYMGKGAESDKNVKQWRRRIFRIILLVNIIVGIPLLYVLHGWLAIAEEELLHVGGLLVINFITTCIALSGLIVRRHLQNQLESLVLILIIVSPMVAVYQLWFTHQPLTVDTYVHDSLYLSGSVILLSFMLSENWFRLFISFYSASMILLSYQFITSIADNKAIYFAIAASALLLVLQAVHLLGPNIKHG